MKNKSKIPATSVGSDPTEVVEDLLTELKNELSSAKEDQRALDNASSKGFPIVPGWNLPSLDEKILRLEAQIEILEWLFKNLPK